ncbi:MAG: peptidyl-prolyl cis-trans isomerase [Planctomycetes bacterium]|nr:peptidyl-prolyl cis-trans isomerase [Planctomycetota bacterium]
MKRLILALSLVGWAATPELAVAAEGNPNPRVKLETTLGDIVVELDAAKAPITTENFLTYARDKFYDGTVFHRVISNFMIQGGGYDTDLNEKPTRSPIKNEWENGLKNVRGTIAMARTTAPDSASAQFFINVVDNPKLDQPISGGAGYAVFGKVVEGMDVVDKIRATPTQDSPKFAGAGKVVPVTAVVIKSARVVGASAMDGATKNEAAPAAPAKDAPKPGGQP